MATLGCMLLFAVPVVLQHLQLQTQLVVLVFEMSNLSLAL